jgi:hypothetical protein
MKTIVRLVMVGLCGLGIGCASTSAQTHSLASTGRHGTANSGSDTSSAAGHDHGDRAMRDDATTRETGASDRGFDRGVPTPQPAREPMVATPVPQPALPGSPGGFSPTARGRD